MFLQELHDRVVVGFPSLIERDILVTDVISRRSELVQRSAH